MHGGDDTPPEREKRALLSRVGTILAYMLFGYTFLWIILLLNAIGANIEHPSSDDTLTAASNLILVVLWIAWFSVSLLLEYEVLRRSWKLVIALALYICLLGSLYDSAAHLLVSHTLPTLAQIAPGPMAVLKSGLELIGVPLGVGT